MATSHTWPLTWYLVAWHHQDILQRDSWLLLQRVFLWRGSPAWAGQGVRRKLRGRPVQGVGPHAHRVWESEWLPSLPSLTLGLTPLGCLTNCAKCGMQALFSHYLCCSGLLPDLTHLLTSYRRSWLQHSFFSLLNFPQPCIIEVMREKNYCNKHSCYGLNALCHPAQIHMLKS